MVLKRIVELGDSISTNPEVSGGAYDGRTLQPALWLKSIVDAGKKRWFAAQFCHKTDLQKGHKDVIIPMKTVYIGSGSTWEATAGEGSAVTFTTITNLCGVSITPADKNYGIALSNRAIRVSGLDLVKSARDDLTYIAGDAVDKRVFEKLRDGTDATATARGAQRLLGGDATAADELAAGDVITTDMVAGAKRRLQSTINTYHTTSSGEGNSSQEKNPWLNEAGKPFVLLIAPEQEETFLTDSQFVNASEYGGDKVIHSGEIGEYLGIKVVVANNITSYGAAVTHADATTTAVAQHRCYMIKAQKAAALAVGLNPKLIVFDYPSELEKRMIVEQAYEAATLHNDAIVKIDVSDT